MKRSVILISIACTWGQVIAQQNKGRLPDVSMTVKGDLVMPLPAGNPIFNKTTEAIGQLGGCYQIPLYKGLGIGIGGNYSFWVMKPNALAPEIKSGEVRRTVYFGKLQYEHYTGERTFYEFNLRVGSSSYEFRCDSCPNAMPSGLYWSLGTGYYVNATDNLAFGLTLGFDHQAVRYSAEGLGLARFPGRRETVDQSNFKNILIGLSFSTRLRKSVRDVRGW
ncbi:MAG TPA: hypothetical protein PK760_09655 [Flavobacteriales bacterium]|nr:hypothetical protein [Flavobacteriales bacterium]